MVTSRSPPPHSLNMDHSLAFSVNQNPAVTMETVTSCSLSPWWWNMEILGHAQFVKNTTENKQTGCLQIIVTFYWTTHTHTHLYGCTDSVSGGRGFSERRRSYVEHCTNNELADMRRMSWCCSCENKHDVFESNMFVCWHNVRTQSLISGQNVVHRDVKIFKLCFTEHSFSLTLWRRSLLTAAEWWSHKLNLIYDGSSYSVWYLLWW